MAGSSARALVQRARIAARAAGRRGAGDRNKRAAFGPVWRGGLAILATLLMVMLGGSWVPSFIFPPWLQAVSAWMHTHWVVEGLDAMTWRGLPLQTALLPLAAMLGFTLLFSAVALARFQWEE